MIPALLVELVTPQALAERSRFESAKWAKANPDARIEAR